MCLLLSRVSYLHILIVNKIWLKGLKQGLSVLLLGQPCLLILLLFFVETSLLQLCFVFGIELFPFLLNFFEKGLMSINS